MLVRAFFRWWYSTGWLRMATEIKRHLIRLGQTFSVGLLLRTLFKPWKQITALRDPNATLGMRLRGLVDNLVSRFVGLTVRILTLISGSIAIVVLGLMGALVLISWPFMPLLTLGLIVKSTGVI